MGKKLSKYAMKLKLKSDLYIEKGGIYAELEKVVVISAGTSNEFEEGTILCFIFLKIVVKLNCGRF